MAFEKTVIFVKPEALIYEDQVIKHLERIGGHAVRTRRVKLTSEILHAVYPGLSLKFSLWNAICDHLLDKVVLTAEIEGDSVVSLVMDAVGKHFDPEQCGQASIRFTYHARAGQMFQPVFLRDGSGLYYRNYVHRARMVQEAEVQIRALFGATN